MTVAEGLAGAAAFEALRKALGGGDLVDADTLREPAFARLIAALHQMEGGGQARPTPLDLAVLVRHALRYEELGSGGADGVAIRVCSAEGWPSLTDWECVGVSAEPSGDGYLIRALPWQPTWLPHVPATGVDASAAGEVERQKDPGPAGDPFLARLKLSSYRTSGQRSAVRAALTAPPGSTLLVCLPTGDGKSTVFQLVAELGYKAAQNGVTVVVMPTVALALDQERTAHALGFKGALAYRGGDTSGETDEMVKRIADGTQKLCFASPEAVRGRLRGAILEAAEAGCLNALVIDEAHLVEAWGTSFRSEFQVLSGLRRAILQMEGGRRLRTLLLSATLTEHTMHTLKDLFGADHDERPAFAVFAAPRLRPEIEYWVAPSCGVGERETRVAEALLHVPRPALLYVTKVSHAGEWHKRLRGLGFGRVASFTGTTSDAEKQRVVDGWGDGTIDLVVATSAFGMGIDNPHVRTVIHACVPETLDRFYQEVGRGGRDNRASLSLLLPATGDEVVARDLNAQRVISVEKGLMRWTAMFNAKVQGPDPDSWILPLDAAPGVDEHYIDMENDKSTAWNVRTLNLMAAAGFIRLFAPDASRDETTAGSDKVSALVRPLQRIQILASDHLLHEAWAERVEPKRRALIDAYRRNLGAMLQFLRATDCAGALIAPLYEVTGLTVAGGTHLTITIPRACSGCPNCRAHGRVPLFPPVIPTPFPWPGQPVNRSRGASLLGAENRVVVFCPPLDRLPLAKRRRFRETLASLVTTAGIHNLIVPPNAGVDIAKLQDEAGKWPLFVEQRLVPNELPPGPTVVVLPPGTRVERAMLKVRAATDARFFFLPEETEDPLTPAVALAERMGGPRYTLDQFLGEV